MATTWFPDGWVLDVPNPGYGELLVQAPRDPYRGAPLVDEDWETTLNGAEVGEFLEGVTARALGPQPSEASRLPEFITAPAARALLPTLQKAVVEAVAGGDRFERTFLDPAEPPPRPRCVLCGEGSYDTAEQTVSSDWCDRYGHKAFGMGSETPWETALTRHQWLLRGWEARQGQEGSA